MSHITVTLKELKPNPFRKEIQGGHLDEGKIALLRESIAQTGFWENVVVRRCRSEVQLAYGHKRTEAAIRELGPTHKVTLPVMDLDDAAMLRMMAMENATGETDSVEAQVDTVVLARRFLTEQPTTCPLRGHVAVRPQGGGNQHECPTVRCVSSFLGEKNWSRSKVGELLTMHEKLDPKVLKQLQTSGVISSQRGSALSAKSGVLLTSLPKPTQVAVANALKEANGHARLYDVERIVKTAKAAPKDKQHYAAVKAATRVADEVTERRKVYGTNKKDKQSLDIVAYITNALVDLRKSEQAVRMVSEFVDHVKRETEEHPLDRYKANTFVSEFRTLGRSLVRSYQDIFEDLKGGS